MRRWKKACLAAATALWLGTSAVPYGQPANTANAATAAIRNAAGLQTSLKQHLDRRETTFTLTYKGSTISLSDRVEEAIEAVLDADDSLGYTVSSYRWSISSTKTEASVKVQVSYWENAKQTAYVVERTKQIAKEIIKPGMNAHQKVKAVHDWVLLNVSYDRTLVQHSAYAALTKGYTVCQGYALLTYRLLIEAGVENRIAEGTVSTGLHAWNLVKLDGKWYHLDTTFDDPVPDVKGRTTYSYYLIPDRQIRKDHAWTKTYPEAVTSYSDTLDSLKAKDKKNAEFYAKLEETLGYPFLKKENTVKSVEELAVKIRAALKDGRNSVKVRWTGGSVSSQLKRLTDEVAELDSYTWSATAFPLGDKGDVILEVKFE